MRDEAKGDRGQVEIKLIYGRHGFQSTDDKGTDNKLEIHYFSKTNGIEDFPLRKRSDNIKDKKLRDLPKSFGARNCISKIHIF